MYLYQLLSQDNTKPRATWSAITWTWQRPCRCLLSMSIFPLPRDLRPHAPTLLPCQHWSKHLIIGVPLSYVSCIAVLQISRFDLYVYWKRYCSSAVFWSRYKDIIGLIITNFTLNCTRITHYRRRGAGPMPAPASHRPLLLSIYNTQICFNWSLGQLFAI